MNEKEILFEVIQILRKTDAQKREVTAQTLIFTELDFDSLQMLNLIETFQEHFGVDFFAIPNSLMDLRTPSSVAAAIIRTNSAKGLD